MPWFSDDMYRILQRLHYLITLYHLMNDLLTIIFYPFFEEVTT